MSVEKKYIPELTPDAKKPFEGLGQKNEFGAVADEVARKIMIEKKSEREALEGVMRETWRKILEDRKYKRFGEVEDVEGDGVGESLPCSGSFLMDAIGFRVFNADYVTWLANQKKSDAVGLGIGRGSIFIRDPLLYSRVVLLDPKAGRFGKRGWIHDLVRGTVGIRNVVEEELEDEGKFHKELREATAPFTTVVKNETLYLDVMRDHILEVHEGWDVDFNEANEAGKIPEVDLGDALKRYTMGAVTEAVMGIRDIDDAIDKLNEIEFEGKKTNIGGFDGLKSSIRKSAERISSVISTADIYRNQKLEVEYKAAVAVIDTWAAYVDQFAPHKHINGDITFIGKLHELYPDIEGDEEETLENREIRRDQIKGLQIAGFETTAPTMLKMFEVLQNDPAIEREVYKAVLVGDDLYLRDFWKEVTRYYPTIPMLSRTAKKDVEIETRIEGEMKKATIKEGEYVSIDVANANRNPEYWPKIGPSVADFDPDRWAIYRSLEEKLRAEKKRLKTGYLTFGDGQTSCIGPKFAEAEAIEFLKWYMKKPYKLRYVKGTGPKLHQDWIITEPVDIEVMAKLEPRQAEEFLDINTANELGNLSVKKTKFEIPGLEEYAKQDEIEDDAGEPAPKCPFHAIFGKGKKS